MGWWKDFSTAASGVVDTVATVVEDVVETAGDAVTDIVETAGNAAQDGLNAAGRRLLQIPGPGGFVRGALAWLGGIIAGVTNLFGASIKGLCGIVAGVLAGLVRIVGGLLLLNLNLIVKGFIDIGAAIAGAVILIAGTLWSLIQRTFFLQSNERSLTKEERTLLRNVFVDSLSLYNIRLIEGWSGLFGINNRAFTLGNTIYMKGNDARQVPDILVHECVHVWQYQNVGSRYTMDALGAQARYGSDAHNWEDELERGNSDWNDFNKEAQAQLMQNIWTEGSSTFNGVTTSGAGSFFTLNTQANSDNRTVEFIFQGTDHTDLAIAAIKSLRGRINLRWSRNF